MEQKGLLISLPSILSWADTVHDRMVKETAKNKVIPRVAWVAVGIASVVTVCFAALYNILAAPVHLIYTHSSVTPAQEVVPTTQATPSTKGAHTTKEAASRRIQQSLEEQLTFRNAPLTPQALQIIIKNMNTLEGRDYLKNNPEKMHSLVPCRNNNTSATQEASLLSREMVYQIQTDQQKASCYLTGVFIFLRTLGLELDSQGFIMRSWHDVRIDKNQMKMLSTALISLSECGFGLLAREILSTIRACEDVFDAGRIFLKPAERALARGSLAAALPKDPDQPGTAPNQWWKKDNTVNTWGNYLNSDYWSPNLPPLETRYSPRWFSLAQTLDSAPIHNLYPSHYQWDHHYKGKSQAPVDIDPIFTGGKTGVPLLIWHAETKQWLPPFIARKFFQK